LVRAPAARLAEGIVTHISRSPVDLDLARVQHRSYVDTLAREGWQPVVIPVADELPDSVFVEDAVVIHDGLAVLTRPGAPSRRPEIDAVATALRDLDLTVTRIDAPGTLDGGDVLRVNDNVYVGTGRRTNGAGAAQLGAALAGRGLRVTPVPLGPVLHLKSAVTALPDGTFLIWPGLVDGAAFPDARPVAEEPGCHVVPLGGDRVLIAASAPRTADAIATLGWTPVPVDITEFEKLEGCVTCLSVLIPTTGRT
jgi:dimethylargininase